MDTELPKVSGAEVFVLLDSGQVMSGQEESDMLGKVPSTWFGYVQCDSTLVEKVSRFVSENKTKVWNG